ncbi:uncharacterized protein LOC128896814 [Hylaeus anthracinus]|uniref:uncharacterized protein LOC128896814 n=1 Tax=Hylaeus anthracinus TaxID=313031 RepID=UPI0023B94033|nr:uncharacterized protein LOC128896814 [Hylaeus anthracinus]
MEGIIINRINRNKKIYHPRRIDLDDSDYKPARAKREYMEGRKAWEREDRVRKELPKYAPIKEVENNRKALVRKNHGMIRSTFKNEKRFGRTYSRRPRFPNVIPRDTGRDEEEKKKATKIAKEIDELKPAQIIGSLGSERDARDAQEGKEQESNIRTNMMSDEEWEGETSITDKKEEEEETMLIHDENMEDLLKFESIGATVEVIEISTVEERSPSEGQAKENKEMENNEYPEDGEEWGTPQQGRERLCRIM